MKGMELPVNIIIVIAIAVLVLVVISAFFLGNFLNTGNTIGLEQARGDGCNSLRAWYDCRPSSVNSITIPGYKPNGQSGCTLGYVCSQLNLQNTVQCAKSCGCPTEGEAEESLATSCGASTNTNGLPDVPGIPPGP